MFLNRILLSRISIIPLLATLLYPALAYAQGLTFSFSFFSCPSVTDFKSFVLVVICQVINPLVTLIVLLALIFFLWGGAQFILNADSEEARTKGRQKMIWGIIALFVMVSIWGIIMILQNTFFGGVPSAGPTFPGFSGGASGGAPSGASSGASGGGSTGGGGADGGIIGPI